MPSDELKAERVRGNKRCNSTPGLFSAAASTVQPRSGSKWFPPSPKTKETLEGQRFSCDEEVKSAVRKWFQKHQFLFF
jgi:hypothetical protein